MKFESKEAILISDHFLTTKILETKDFTIIAMLYVKNELWKPCDRHLTVKYICTLNGDA